MLPNAKSLLEDTLGIHTDRVSTNAGGTMSLYNPLSDKQHEVIEKAISEIYYDFIGKVAEGRNMTPEEVDQIAQGRVWSGTDALEEGLVDVIGNLEDAKQIAAEAAGITSYDIYEYPALIDPFQKMIQELTGQVSTEKIATKLGVDSDLIKELNFLLNQGDGLSIQARMPYSFTIN